MTFDDAFNAGVDAGLRSNNLHGFADAYKQANWFTNGVRAVGRGIAGGGRAAMNTASNVIHAPGDLTRSMVGAGIGAAGALGTQEEGDGFWKTVGRAGAGAGLGAVGGFYGRRMVNGLNNMAGQAGSAAVKTSSWGRALVGTGVGLAGGLAMRDPDEGAGATIGRMALLGGLGGLGGYHSKALMGKLRGGSPAQAAQQRTLQNQKAVANSGRMAVDRTIHTAGTPTPPGAKVIPRSRPVGTSLRDRVVAQQANTRRDAFHATPEGQASLAQSMALPAGDNPAFKRRVGYNTGR